MQDRCRVWFVGVAAVSMVTIGSIDAHAEWDPDPLNAETVLEHDYRCGPQDLPEEGIQGDVPTADQDSGRAQQGYNCGLALVGHTSLDAGGRPATGNANMAWAGDCAYIAGPGGGIAPQTYSPPAPENGVAVVDVRNPTHPVHVRTLHSPGSAATSETINAVTTPEGRSILVIGQYGNDAVATSPKPMDVYDVTGDCADPVLLTTFGWPQNVHNLTLSPDGRYVFATQPLAAADISGLWDDDQATGVVYLGNIQDAVTGPPVATGPTADLDDPLPIAVPSVRRPLPTGHEAWPSPDFATNPDGHQYLYVGGQTAAYEMLNILDLHDWLQRDASNAPSGPPVVVAQQSGRGHSIRTATIAGRRYLLHSEESVFGTAYGCIPETANPFAGPAQPWLTDITDPAHPDLVAQMGLEINDPANCAAQLNSGANQSVHYHDVDDAADTTFVMASMLNAGIRIFDVRDPLHPTEVAYFNPGDVDPSAGVLLDRAWAHVRYVPETGEIWFATGNGGFWVVRIEGQVRAQLGLDNANERHGLPALRRPVNDPGAPGTVGASLRTLSALDGIDTTPAYCTISAVSLGLG